MPPGQVLQWSHSQNTQATENMDTNRSKNPARIKLISGIKEDQLEETPSYAKVLNCIENNKWMTEEEAQQPEIEKRQVGKEKLIIPWELHNPNHETLYGNFLWFCAQNLIHSQTLISTGN